MRENARRRGWSRLWRPGVAARAVRKPAAPCKQQPFELLMKSRYALPAVIEAWIMSMTDRRQRGGDQFNFFAEPASPSSGSPRVTRRTAIMNLSAGTCSAEPPDPEWYRRLRGPRPVLFHGRALVFADTARCNRRTSMIGARARTVRRNPFYRRSDNTVYPVRAIPVSTVAQAAGKVHHRNSSCVAHFPTVCRNADRPGQAVSGGAPGAG